MRALAGVLRVKAATIGSMAQDASSIVAKVPAQGRYIKRYEGDARTIASFAGTAAERLTETADLLMREASAVEQRIWAAQREEAARAREQQQGLPQNPFGSPWGL